MLLRLSVPRTFGERFCHLVLRACIKHKDIFKWNCAPTFLLTDMFFFQYIYNMHNMYIHFYFYIFREVLKFWNCVLSFTDCYHYQIRIQNSVKHLRWSSLLKTVNCLLKTVFTKSATLDVWMILYTPVIVTIVCYNVYLPLLDNTLVVYIVIVGL